MAETDQQFEQKHLDQIMDQLHDADKRLSQEISKARSEEKSLNENFFNDFSINLSNDAEAIETAASIQQQQQLLDERSNSWQQSNQQLQTVRRLTGNPFFARIDFQEGNEKPETIYIGLGSFTDPKGKFLIYDWRAPISSIYYDGGLGNVVYQTPDGPQSVDVALKRQFVIRDGQIQTMFDTTETIGDQMLLEVLGEKSDTQMKSIVTTIQQEQNQIIRDTSADLLFVQGAAGSGKTSAVLQRVAYLLYRYRGNLNASQVIMFSPNQLFADYISNVLPELGEQNMVQFTYYQYVTRRVPGIDVQSLFSQFETVQTPVQHQIAVLKGSLDFFETTKKYATSLEKSGMRFRDIKFQGEVFFSRKRIADIFYSYNENYHLGNRLTATKERLINMLNRRVESELKAKWVSEAVENLDPEDIRQLQNDGPQEFKSSDDEYRFFARKIVVKAFAEIQHAIVKNRFLNVRGQYVSFLRDAPKFGILANSDVSEAEWQASVDEFVTEFKDRQLTMADATPYLHLYDLMTGRHGERNMRYVFVDEIQDYTPYQLAYLKASFPKAKFTLLGDLNQAIFTKADSHTLMNDTSKLFDPDKTRVVQLTQSYRSTAQVTDFTKAILHSGQKIVAFNRQGPLPSIRVRQTEAELMTALAAQLEINDAAKQTTAVIAKTLEDAEAIYEQMRAQGIAATLIRSENQRLASGVLVVPSFLAKGLEFDAVIVWQANKANFNREDERELMYTITSRAMHRLTILASPDLSPLLAEIPSELYTQD
ncbi:RNA polymerase recycling motor HelD [Lacticaseibacillus saniviri]|uniref:DNA helicase n=1 Tax=Lacticaseibacillus saniviri JCM 17471 = DSM 24301 TaxID=1293598 RepID=A0A0R2MUS6_9LACO|nr:RNA polymerase recycling motor HelD [Lacticaseibacillus saniviri]KRO17161.1 DNA helicase [Lacticaseibacillus saniviri JCM 17471 = DSM 24301]MCG4283043.1 AAA family ATPase [Lacticaseibacillus saniviri]